MVTVSASDLDLTQLLERHRNLHSGGVDECEEQNIGAVLLVGMEFWFPVVIVRMEPKQWRSFSRTSSYSPPSYPGSVSSASRMYIPITFSGIPS